MSTSSPPRPPALPTPPAPDEDLPSRPLAATINAMTFWDGIFPDAMDRFKLASPEPKGRSKTPFSIRVKDNWDDIYGRLEAARTLYKNQTGFGGWLRKVRRKAADNIQPVIGVTSFVPDLDYVTPVLGAVEVLLDVSHY